KRAYCLKTQPATGETYPKSDLFNKAHCLMRFAYQAYMISAIYRICAIFRKDMVLMPHPA
ncbi:hypothetical protein, partial [Escherichia coli]|uniref:hypothetical protein n=1 Tax=Escherichia coli TaxID=562 RepID=UPI001BC847D8